MTTEERREAMEQTYREGVAATERVDKRLTAGRLRRGQAWKIAFVASCVVLAISLILNTAVARSVVDLRADQVAAQESREAEERRTREAITALQQANEDLRRRGQQPVDQPSQLGDGEALVAAATARVLANLPATPQPTSEQIAAELARYFAVNPVTVSPQRIAQQVASYFAENPVEPEQGEQGEQGERGEKGDKGDPGAKGADGHTPTPDEIMAVFSEAAVQNPNLLCAGKGTFTEVVGFVRVPPENVPSERSFWTCLPG